MSSNIYGFIAGILNFIVLITVAAAGVWLAFAKYQREQNWAKAITIYSETLVSLSGINRIVSEWINEGHDPSLVLDEEAATIRAKEYRKHVETLTQQASAARLYLDDETSKLIRAAQDSLGLSCGTDALSGLAKVVISTNAAIEGIILVARPHTRPLPILQIIKAKGREIVGSIQQIRTNILGWPRKLRLRRRFHRR